MTFQCVNVHTTGDLQEQKEVKCNPTPLPGAPPNHSVIETRPFGEYGFCYSACIGVCTQVDSTMSPQGSSYLMMHFRFSNI